VRLHAWDQKLKCDDVQKLRHDDQRGGYAEQRLLLLLLLFLLILFLIVLLILLLLLRQSAVTMIRVALPFHLRTLAKVTGEVQLDVAPPVTQRSVLDALETRYPMLRGTIRDHVTLKRRAFLRFFACEQDLSNESPDTPLPDAVASGAEPYLIIGALAGG